MKCVIEHYFAEMLSSMTRATGKDFVFNGSFHEAFSSVLVVAQCLAMLPVIGVKSTSAYGLRFTWKSYRTVYSLTAFAFAAAYTIFTIALTLTKPVTFNSIGELLNKCNKYFIIHFTFIVQFLWHFFQQPHMECSVLYFWHGSGPN